MPREKKWVAGLGLAIVMAGAAAQTPPTDIAVLQKRATEAIARLDYRAAMDANRQVIPLAQQAGDTSLVARCYRSIGACLYSLQEVDAALESYRKGLEVATANGHRQVAAEILRGITLCEDWLGRPSESMAAAEESLRLYRELQSPTDLAVALMTLANIRMEQGEQRAAAETYQEGLKIAEENHDTDSIARFLTNLAILYEQQGDYPIAISLVSRRLDDPQMPRTDKRSIARALNILALLYGRTGKYDAAIASIDRGVALMRGPGGDPVLEAILISQRGTLWRQQGQYGKALEEYRSFEAICRTYKIPERQAAALEEIASTLILMGRNQEALAAAQEGLALARQVSSPVLEWQLQYAEGLALSRLGRVADAETALQAAVQSVESQRRQIAGGSEEGRNFFDRAVGPYKELMAIRVAQRQPAAALEFAERAKARHLLDVMTQGRVRITQAMSETEKEEEQRLSEEASRCNLLLTRQKVRDPRMAAAFDRASSTLEAFRAQLYASHPELQVRRGEARPLTPAETDALLPDAKTLFLEFAVTQDAVYLITLERGTPGRPVLSARKLAITPSALEKEAGQLRERLASRDLLYRESAAHLYQELLAPVQDKLASHFLVGIVPDGPIWNLPFQALVDGGGEYFIARHAVFYSPSLSALRAGARLHRAATRTSRTLLAIGPPAGDARADAEVRAIGKLYGPGAATVLTGAAATERRWKQEAPQYRILHIATHGILNPRNPLFSYLQLGPDAAGGEDGMLEAHEIMDLDLRAELAILSACDTARGQVRDGEGIVGMSWAMMMAGTPSMLASQWQVDSASTMQLMVAFHRAFEGRVKAGEPIKGKAAALRDAMLELSHTPEYRHPFYWSAFQLLGDGY